jgi:hypothetical protein
LIKDLNEAKKNIILNYIDEIKRKFYEIDSSDRTIENDLRDSGDSFMNTTNSQDLEELHIISQPENSKEESLNEEKNTKIDLFDTSKRIRNKIDECTSSTHFFETLHTLCSTPLQPYPLKKSVYIPTYNDLSLTQKAYGQTTGKTTDQNTGQIMDQNNGQTSYQNTGQMTNFTTTNSAVSILNTAR